MSVALKCVLPSLAGAMLFLLPVSIDGSMTVPMAALSYSLQAQAGELAVPIVVAVCMISALGAAFVSLGGQYSRAVLPVPVRLLFTVPLPWLLLRLLGAAIGFGVLTGVGPDLFVGDSTGAMVFADVGVPLTFIATVACLLMPLLTDYGLLEFVGTLIQRPFARVFRVPGRGAIDAVASFVSAASVGLIITIGQYDRGRYTAREAAAVALNFSVVSIPFSIVVASVANISEFFLPWYGSVVFVVITAALITVRLPPLSQIPDTYRAGKQGPPPVEDPDSSVLVRASAAALATAASAPDAVPLFFRSLRSAVEVLLSVVAPSMAIATLASVLMFHTPIFDVLSLPLQWVLELLQLPYPERAAPAFFIGFIDQFVPAIIAADIESDVTRWVLAGLSVTQLVYMAEVGVLVLRSSLPVTLWQLLGLFALRTVIAFPILYAAAVLMVGD
jgi:nucleoside recognition membrane protein YjiH